MNAITQAIVSYSILEVSHIKITNATKDTFTMSITSRVTKTGLVGATMSAMTVDMVGSGGTFGRLDLPVVKTSPSGADVIITDQLIKILDMNAFKSFVQSIMKDESLTLRLANGKATIKSWGLSAQIVYEKELHLGGMKGPQTTMVKTESLGEKPGFRNTMKISNPSPFELDMGVVLFGIFDGEGKKVAEQKGKQYIVRGANGCG